MELPLTVPLGESLPPKHGHALSVSMPKWADVIGYEEGDDRVVNALACGYPRFSKHPQVEKLIQVVKDKYVQCKADQDVVVLPCESSAKRLAEMLQRNYTNDVDAVQIQHVERLIWAVQFPMQLQSIAKQFWQHSGEIVSSRHAEYVLQALENGQQEPPKMNGTETHKALCERVASLYTTTAIDASKDVLVYPTGMGAMFAAVRLLQQTRGLELKSILFGFPYVDTLKILQRPEWCENGVYFFPVCDDKAMQEVETILKKEKILGIFTEFPGNPLLASPDVQKLAQLAHEHDSVLVVDDTVASYNVDPMKDHGADMVVTSLSKLFSGTCTVMAGSLVLNSTSAVYGSVQKQLETTEGKNESFIVLEDAKVLVETSKDLRSRLDRVNKSTSIIAKRLESHPLVKNVFYPELNPDVNNYKKLLDDSVSEDTPRFGPLLSIVLHGGFETAQRFYDNVEIAKGPSLGTNFTLACPFPYLAHYNELDYVETCGVDRNLVRITIGLEDPETIWNVFKKALDSAQLAQ